LAIYALIAGVVLILISPCEKINAGCKIKIVNAYIYFKNTKS
jgi:hypothetical protein